MFFNVGFTLLAQRFDYPDILRRPTDEILERFRVGGTGLILIWWAFALSAVLFAALAALLAIAVNDAEPTVVVLGRRVRRARVGGPVPRPDPLAVPGSLPGSGRPPAPLPAHQRAESVDIVFQSFNRYLGVAVGEHLGYAFTGIWSILAGVALVDSAVVADWLGVVGIVLGPLFLVCSLEFVGGTRAPAGGLAETLTPITYIGWSIWLIAVGVGLLV